MSTLTVRERIQAIQRTLGVSPDGLIGPVTLTRLESILARCLGATPTEEPNLVVSQRGLDLIVSHEIGSEANYRRRLTNPIWPGGQSGVTIGIGYDLGYNAASQVEKDWRGRIADAHLADLQEVVGLKKEEGRRACSRVKHVEVPLVAAKEVFYTSTLPRFARITQSAYPGIEALPADAQAALLSLVYNRGAAKSGAPRREMKAIEPLVTAQNLPGIADQIRAMKRIWEGRGLPGLLRRRDEEADLVEHADRAYAADELVRL